MKNGRLVFIKRYLPDYTRYYATAGFNLNSHYVYQNGQGLVYPLTHQPVVYKGLVPTVLISTLDINNEPFKQYMVPLAHRLHNNVYNIVPNKMCSQYFLKYSEAIQAIAARVEEHELILKDFSEYEDDNEILDTLSSIKLIK